MKWKQVIFVCCVAGFSLACTPRAVRDAERVVAQADSLRAEGRMYGIDGSVNIESLPLQSGIYVVKTIFSDGTFNTNKIIK